MGNMKVTVVCFELSVVMHELHQNHEERMIVLINRRY